MGDWRVWLVRAGRGWGKTRTGAEWVLEQIVAGRKRIALVARTAADVREVMVEGESGILACSPDSDRPRYEPSKRRLTWNNGTIATTYSADEPDLLRGPSHDAAWCDELATWQRPETFDMLMLGLRLGDDPRCVVTTTPRPTKIIRELRANPATVETIGTTYENRANLADAFFEQIIGKYEGTRLGRQELLAEMLEDNPGALWRRNVIDDSRVTEHPALRRIVVAIDPAATANEESDDTGIIVAGIGVDGQGYVLEDCSLHDHPDRWARAAVAAYHRHHADRVVAEVNNGGEMVEHVVRTVDSKVSYKAVHASRGKQTRAEPVAALYEQGKIHHVGFFPALEDEMCSWEPGGDSPDRVDACLIAGTLVTTDSGLVPIERVTRGMRVLTRSGYQSVLASAMTDEDATVLTLVASNGQSLTGTANHPVYIDEKGFIPLAEVRPGDVLCFEKKLNSTAKHLCDIRNRQAERTGFISRHRRVDMLKTSERFIKKYGGSSMEKSRRVIAFITLMATRLITQLRISYAYRPRNMRGYMPRNIMMHAQSISRVLDHLQRFGMDPRPVLSGIGNMVRGYLIHSSQMWNAVVCNVGSCFSQKLSALACVSAHDCVIHVGTNQTGVTTRSDSALCVEPRLVPKKVKNNSVAPVRVVGLKDAGKACVYNLEIEDAHEYYANGILVHNCVWALTELMLPSGVFARPSFGAGRERPAF